MINVKRTTPQEEANPYEGLGAADVIDRGLLDNDTHVIVGEIDDESIALAMRWMIYENTTPIQKTLTLYINSIGGDLYDGLGLIDLMRSSKHVIRTVGIGNVMSTAFLIFCAGTRGFRYIGANTNILSHQYSDGIEGKHHDIRSYMKSAEYTNESMVRLLQECTGLDARAVKSRLLPHSDVWLTPKELIQLGGADHLL